MKITLPLMSIVFLLLFCEMLQSQITHYNNNSSGYQNGSLIIIGGGIIDTLIMEEFKKYAAGDSAKIVVIPTALDDNYLLKDSAFYETKKKL